MIGTRKKGIVAVGMSGGVDSSVAAALLKKQGYEVIGVYFITSDQTTSGKIRDNICCSLESMMDARKVAQQLGCKFYTVNLRTVFKEKVFDDFIKEYESGRTPNPCIHCNKFVKFGEALRKVKLLGADYLATGHYARIKKTLKHKNIKTGKQESRYIYRLFEGKDKNKDQTYFLHTLGQDQLAHIMFPLGKLTKPKVRKIAAKFNLPTASKVESQEICFIPDGDVANFLRQHIDFKSGDIFDIETKEKVGEHDGLQAFTVGQRKGIGLPGGPWYVAKLDIRKSVLYVTKNIDLIYKKQMKVRNIHWIVGESKLPAKIQVKIRYNSDPVAVTVQSKEGDDYIVEFDKPQKAITPGQSAVFLKKDECLGGGIIEG